MNKTKIEWCDMTFNPVTGCLHGCEYCYAKQMTVRFSGHWDDSKCRTVGGNGELHVLDEPMKRHTTGKNREVGVHSVIAPFPFGFDPTFHRYRLSQPARKKGPRTIFVCSMADLFGPWVPTKWIVDVLDACLAAPQHRYLFLTKYPSRYMDLAKVCLLPERDNFWYGSTVTGPDAQFWWSDHHNTFVSIEPMLEEFPASSDDTVKKVDWVIMGAMTGPGSNDHQPRREWVESLVADSKSAGVPVFMKGSLRPIVGDAGMLTQFPWQTQALKGAAPDAGASAAQDVLMSAT